MPVGGSYISLDYGLRIGGRDALKYILNAAQGAYGLTGNAATLDYSGSSPTTGFLASGHYVPENQPMVVVAPRPVSELSAWSFYQFAYYDGTNQLQMRYPLGVLGGSFPYVYGFTGTVPPGVTIPQPYWIPGYTWAQMQALGYGYVYYTPPLGSAIGDVISWTVRCYSQDYQTDSSKYIDIPMTVTLAGAYNSTSGTGYVFMSTTGSDSNVNPTISAPLATLTGVYSATSGATQYPNGILIARGGTYAMLAPGGTALAIEGGVNCTSMMAYPGETVTFALDSAGTNGTGISLGNSAASGSDIFLQGIGFSGSNSAVNYWYVGSFQLSNRIVMDSLYCPNVWSGTGPTENATVFYCNDSTGSVTRQYIFHNNCIETNRVAASGSSVNGAIHVIYKADYCLTQGSSATGNTTSDPPYGIGYKAGNSYCEMRCNTAWNLQLGAQYTDNSPTGSIEYRYNNVNGVFLNTQNGSGSTSPLGSTWLNRNSVLYSGGGAAIQVDYPPEITTVASVSDAIQYGSAIPITVATGITDTNTEAQAASGVFSTFPALANSALVGTRGSVIA